MSKLFRGDDGGPVQIIQPNWAKIQNVTVSGSSSPTTNGAPHGCTLVMLISTTNCWFRADAQGVTPTAAKDATSIYLPAGVYFYLPATEGTKVAFIQDSAGGTAQVIPAL